MSKNVFGEDQRLDLDRVSRDETWLSGRVSLPGQGGVGLTPAMADARYVQLNGLNQALWIPNAGGDATQDITGNFNLAGAAYQYEIGGALALCTGDDEGNLTNVSLGSGANARLSKQSVYVGYGAGADNTGNYNNVIGYEAGGNAATVVSFDYNQLIGWQAAYGIISGEDNIIIGYKAGFSIANGDDNVIVGSEAAYGLTGDCMVVIGNETGYKLTGAIDSVIIGAHGLYNITGAFVDGMVAIGYMVGWAMTTGWESVLIGQGVAINGVSTANDVLIGESAIGTGAYAGEENVVIGADAGWALTTGTNNTLIGYISGQALTTTDGNVFLGNYSGYYETGASKLFIDNAQRASEADARVKALAYGVFAAATADQYLTINGHLIAREQSDFLAGLQTMQSVANVSDPPTDAELDGIFGAPAALGRGFIATVDDNDDDTDCYIVWTSDASWYYLKGTQAG